mgnify:CR=1 FL=1
MTLGGQAETWACQHIQQHGWQVIKRNFSWRGGEIDIIATQADQLAFIEVRCRRSKSMGGTLASINMAKQKRIINTAKLFLQQYSHYQEYQCRFDVVIINGTHGQQLKLQWLKDAFQVID